MPTVMQESVSDSDAEKILEILNSLGEFLWERLWRDDMAIPSNLNVNAKEEEERELILRYLLMRVALNQQGNSLKIRQFASELVEKLGKEFLIRPLEFLSDPKVYDEILSIAQKYGGSKGSDLYSPGRLGGIKPFYITISRLSLFALFIRFLARQKTSLIKLLKGIIKSEESVLQLNNWLMNERCINLAWVGRDPKASRMLTDWIIFIWARIWKEAPLISPHLMQKTIMIVDGHVGKVFSRTGILKKVVYESKRPYIIEASKMRPWIEEIVNAVSMRKGCLLYTSPSPRDRG